MFGASALYRITKTSSCSIDNSGWPETTTGDESVSAPVALLNAVIVKLRKGVALSGRPMIERMRPTGLNEVRCAVSIIHEHTIWLGAFTAVAGAPITPLWTPRLALIRTFET